MPRNYSRITDRQGWDKISMEKAIQAVNNNEMGWLMASKAFNIPQSTLRSHALKQNKVLAPTNKEPPTWSWDNWCLLQPDVGPCYKQVTRYYYNLQFDECSNFTYSSCGGNKNNFETISECKKYCTGSSHLNIVENSSKPSYCQLQPDPGLCLAMIEKFYYDINEQSCKKFTYGGCGGNLNKFGNKGSCMRNCNPHE